MTGFSCQPSWPPHEAKRSHRISLGSCAPGGHRRAGAPRRRRCDRRRRRHRASRGHRSTAGGSARRHRRGATGGRRGPRFGGGGARRARLVEPDRNVVGVDRLVDPDTAARRRVPGCAARSTPSPSALDDATRRSPRRESGTLRSGARPGAWVVDAQRGASLRLGAERPARASHRRGPSITRASPPAPGRRQRAWPPSALGARHRQQEHRDARAAEHVAHRRRPAFGQIARPAEHDDVDVVLG